MKSTFVWPSMASTDSSGIPFMAYRFKSEHKSIFSSIDRKTSKF